MDHIKLSEPASGRHLEQPADAARLRIPAAAAPFLAACFIVTVCNLAFWQRFVLAIGGPGWAGVPVLAGAWLALVLVFGAMLALVNFRFVFKPVLIGLCLLAAVVSYFADHFGTGVDWSMVQNVVETDPREAFELLTPGMVLNVALSGVLPSWLLVRTEIGHAGAARQLPANLVAAALAAAGAALLVLLLFKILAPVLREHRELRFLLTPTNAIHAVHGYLRRKWEVPVTPAPIGLDARKGRAWAGSARRSVTVIVVGETARAANFSLNGYGRATNPRLAAEPGLLNFGHMEACGTSTAVSVPCVFSALGRRDYSARKGKSQEGLLDVLRRAGFRVLWRDNNSGCKGVCDRVESEDLSRPDGLSPLCGLHECHDERLLDGLRERILAAGGDMVVVLHQKGSHGPAYWKRYPERFRAFLPECGSSQLSRCSRAEIVAAYDNTILYLDHVLAETIGLLRELDAAHGIDTSFMYFSDHGESLGERGLYLHGAPWLVAPEQQKRVPFMLWLSDGFLGRFAVDTACLRGKTMDRLSHDNVFHTTLGMLSVDTALYRRGLDVFAGCMGRA